MSYACKLSRSLCMLRELKLFYIIIINIQTNYFMLDYLVYVVIHAVGLAGLLLLLIITLWYLNYPPA